ncbi:hypothetical protein BASA81_001319 [Batrachochytrium salamandrivorans]|nr:hypothetical protein BASA81_001319 [Batrachochytrium salamandrivorans]
MQDLDSGEEDNPLDVAPVANHHHRPRPSTKQPVAATLLPDEVCYSKFDACVRVFSPTAQQQGALQLTNFRIRFTPHRCRCDSLQEMGPPHWHGNSACTMRGAVLPWGGLVSSWPPACTKLSDLKHDALGNEFVQDLPLLCFRRVTLCGHELEIENRLNGQRFKFQFSSPSQVAGLAKLISTLAFPQDPIRSSFAFVSQHRVGLGWNVFDFDLDAEKTLLDRSKRVGLRKVASPCPTYPASIFVPQSMTDLEIGESASFRAKQRLPVPVWAHPANGSLLVRSAQPQIGFVGSLGSWFAGTRSQSDEKLIHELCGSGYLLVDARSFAAAKGNGLIRGMGTEQVGGGAYDGCGEMMFGDMANIHEIRASFDLLANHHSGAGNNNSSSEILLYRNQWLAHVSQLLKVSYALVTAMDTQGVCAWIHCSDGWDRTAQTCALAQLMMEPEYRTKVGFAICVEKNFASYGFKFRERGRGQFKPNTSNGNGTVMYTNEHESSPVFLLFVDAVYQLLMQFPTRFEFDSKFLLAVMDAYFSGRFGTFLCDCDRERLELDVRRKTRSAWDFLCSASPDTSGSYVPYLGTLHVSSKPASLCFFYDYFNQSGGGAATKGGGYF